MSTSLEALTRGGFSIGIELPLDNDWSPAGDARRQHDGRRPGVPDLTHHAD
ncbi:LLM class flavin-dependent oxidoreductase, partial [Paraburkholderia sp. Se-20369]|nr:LLM class flavin-dependent oxidoreductase [Paraburkholderia sp. Se-20369]